MNEFKSRLEQIDREIQRYQPNNNMLKIEKNVLRLLRDEIVNLWTALEGGTVSKKHIEPAADEVETPKREVSNEGELPRGVPPTYQPEFTKSEKEDPRKTGASRDSGESLDDVIKSLRKK